MHGHETEILLGASIQSCCAMISRAPAIVFASNDLAVVAHRLVKCRRFMLGGHHLIGLGRSARAAKAEQDAPEDEHAASRTAKGDADECAGACAPHEGRW